MQRMSVFMAVIRSIEAHRTIAGAWMLVFVIRWQLSSLEQHWTIRQALGWIRSVHHYSIIKYYTVLRSVVFQLNIIHYERSNASGFSYIPAPL